MRLLPLTIFLFLLISCAHERSTLPEPAFYHWQTHLQLTLYERNFLDSLGLRKLYVKFFDVDWDESTHQPVPLASVEMDTCRLTDLHIIPAIFITNRTFLKLEKKDIPDLVNHVVKKIIALSPPLNSPFDQSFQFDCDWTEQTREKFFTFLLLFREKANASSLIRKPFTLSATIRLHQFSFFEKTGVPPVDRGMLMFYNMSDVEDWDTENSILDLEEGKKYLPASRKYPISSIQFPIPLDIALPLFHWGVLFREGRMVKLLNGLDEGDLQDTMRFTEIATGRFRVKKNTYLQAHYLYQDDLLRLEGVEANQLMASAGLLNKVCAQRNLTVSFYHLDAELVREFPSATLKKVLEGFGAEVRW
jgi:hypothetical protein